MRPCVWGAGRQRRQSGEGDRWVRGRCVMLVYVFFLDQHIRAGRWRWSGLMFEVGNGALAVLWRKGRSGRA